MNERDSEIIQQMLAVEGYLPVHSMEQANVIILNTCSIRAKAQQKVYSLLGQIRDSRKKAPDTLVGVAGCVAQQEGARLFERMPHVDFVIGTQRMYQLPEMLNRLRNRQTKRELCTTLEQEFTIPPFQELLQTALPPRDNWKGFVTIMQGCNNFCSFCVVPYTRGREVSRLAEDILEEVRVMTRQGIRDITLLGQNVNSYGKTNAVAEVPVDFSQLLRKVAAIEGVERLRFTTSHPKDLSQDLMRCFAETENLCPHFHLPVQSGSNKILQAMNRKYTIEGYLDKIATLRKYRPDIALATDIIVGFPGESEQDFQKTMDLLEEVRFHGSFSFKYSDRPGTRSADFPEKVPEEVKSERLHRFQSRQDQISLERNQEYLGSVQPVMIETCTEQGLKGRTPTNHIVHCPAFNGCQSYAPGDTLDLFIAHAGKHSLQAAAFAAPAKQAHTSQESL